MHCLNADYVLADDLSGALEAGAAFHGRGLTVITSINDTAATASDIRVLNTNTREAEPAVAASTVHRILTQQRNLGAQLVFKKMDSTLRGPFAAEVAEIRRVLRPPLIVVCPANPAAGRTIRGGTLYVQGVPVASSVFRRDPGWPVKVSRIAAALSKSLQGPFGHLPLTQLRSRRSLPMQLCRGILVSDAETDADLRHLVRLTLAASSRTVFVGAGGLAHALAAATSAGRPLVGIPFVTSALVVSGSRHARSRQQLRCLQRRWPGAVHTAESQDRNLARLAANVRRTLETNRVAGLQLNPTSRWVNPLSGTDRLAEVARLVCEANESPGLVAATGGETAAAVCTALGIHELAIRGELAPGVTLTSPTPQLAGQPPWIVIKPGGFGPHRLWSDLLAGVIDHGGHAATAKTAQARGLVDPH